MATVRSRTLGSGAGAKVGMQVISIPAADASVAVDQHSWIADGTYRVVSVESIWSVASTSGTIMVTRTQGTEAPSAGDSLLTAVIDTSGTADTVNTATLSATEALLTLVAGDRISLNFGGTVTNLLGLTVTVGLMPDPDILHWQR